MIAATLYAVAACLLVVGLGIALGVIFYEVRTDLEDARRAEHHHLEISDAETDR